MARKFTKRKRWGGAILEMALAAPILVMLSFGTVEYGYYIYVKNEMYGAASNGAQEASLDTCTDTSVATAVSNAMSNAGLSHSGYTVTTSPSTVVGAASGTSMSVTVTLTWGNVGVNPLPVALGGISTSKQMTTTATMRRQ
jgi:Flp pilus assembly protein TadG